MDNIIGYYAQLPNGELARIENSTLVLYNKKRLKDYLEAKDDQANSPKGQTYQMVKLDFDDFFERIDQGEVFVLGEVAFYQLTFKYYLDGLIVRPMATDGGLELKQVHLNPLMNSQVETREEEDDYKMFYSPLSQAYTKDGVTVHVEIYRGEEQDSWVLEVVDCYGDSLIYDERFSDDKLAWRRFIQDVEEEGMEYFLDDDDETSQYLH